MSLNDETLLKELQQLDNILIAQLKQEEQIETYVSETGTRSGGINSAYKICSCGATTPTSHAHWCPNSPTTPSLRWENSPLSNSLNQEDLAPKETHLKEDWTVFPFEEADFVRKVFEYGAKKYGAPFTYRRGKGVHENDLWAAVFRHMLKIRAGEDIDPESLCYHWGHIAANALMAISTLLIKKRQNLT